MTPADILLKMCSGRFLAVDKVVQRRFGVDAAVVLAELRGRAEANRGMDFECSVNSLERECNVTQRQQAPILRKLESAGYIRVSYAGNRRRIAVLK